MTLTEAKKIYIVGIRGVGMSGLACALVGMGKEVIGSDAPTSKGTPTARLLDNQKIFVYDEFLADHIDQSIDFVVTPVLFDGPDNIEAVSARSLGIQTESYAKVVGELVGLCKTSVSVCGTHGKTTTASLLTSICQDLGLPTTHVVGTAEFNNGRLPGGSTGFEYGVFEADEYISSVGHDLTPKLLYQHPTHAICTNVDFDHPDIFASINDIESTFRTFFENLSQKNETLIYCHENKRLTDIVADMRDLKSISYGFVDAHYTARDIKQSGGIYSFAVFCQNQKLIDCTLLIQGEHNVLNALSTIAFCHQQGLDLEKVVKSISGFSPAQRRLQKLFDQGVVYFDDYAHHPIEIEVVLKTVRELYPDRRMVMVFQPHTASRTEALKEEFVDSFVLADKVYLLPIYGSVREKEDKTSITSQDLIKLGVQKGNSSITFVTNDMVIEKVMGDLKKDDVLLTVGASDQVFSLREKFIEELKKKV